MKKIISLIISLGILAIIYWKIDFRGLLPVFAHCHPGWMITSLALVIPLTFLTAWRFQQMIPLEVAFPIGEATRLTLAASVLNLVLPSKMGDLAKAYFLKNQGHLQGSLAFSLVVFEKTCDMLSLLLWGILGLLLYPQKDALFWMMTFAIVSGTILGFGLLSSKKLAKTFFYYSSHFSPKKIAEKLHKLEEAWLTMHDYFWKDRNRLFRVALTSIFLWFLHLFQIWLFILALRASVPFLTNLALSPLAILAGLIPLTFAGVGTRDGALIYFYQPYFNAHIAAALGLLCTARYVLPAIGGLPFFAKYFSQLKTKS
ncbi:MAG: flippase-like domain-containing protein [Verrucomicrobiae bacterium]|nr:flippase-like domain-containing protein [Verrucomicrobiae bacterium]